ncbi:MAG TPA: hypothetical protein VI935_05155 [Thermodesulfobacteriota bacterium]|nr:hypothetical protein [Thermodesulfobacteriota bacterium]
METLFSTIQHYLPFLFTGISLISIGISVKSYRMASRYQNFDYAVKLQTIDEIIKFGSPSSPEFNYSTKIENRGQKPVKIERVYIDYGSRDDPKKRIKHVIEGQFYLRPGEPREIKLNLSQSEVESIRQKFDRQCMFFLRVLYHTAEGRIAEVTRFLGGYDKDMIIFVVQRGESLT